MLELRNKAAFLKKLDLLKRRVEFRTGLHVQRQVRKILELVLKESPQYSGDFAANWRVSVNGGQHSYQKTLYKQVMGDDRRSGGKAEPLQAGHPMAINLAMTEAQGELSSIRWDSKVKLINSSPIAPSIATGEMEPPYRIVHQHLVGLAFVTYIQHKWKLKG